MHTQTYANTLFDAHTKMSTCTIRHTRQETFILIYLMEILAQALVVLVQQRLILPNGRTV
jgi:hypothetical protein